MAIVTVQKPDNISMSGNLKELILQSADAVEVKLSIGATVLLQETYYPGNGNLIHVDFADVVTTQLSFVLPSSDVFIQTGISKDFKIEYTGTAYTFRCIRSGKMNLTQSATAFLTENFLTWQPNTKPVTFYSPEWLTYFAPTACQVRLKAYWEDKTNTVITLASPSAGSCYTFNVQYAVVSGKFSGKRPMYYDVWVESGDTRLSYVQRYVASEQQGEDEQWYLFENSLGGLDSLRAYGALKDEPEYTHNIANFGDQSEEFRIDVRRMQTRNTGNLTPDEARWLQDMFPSPQKYLYSISGLYPIVFTGGDASADTSKLPDSYTFTYRLSDTRPYLDIQRRTDLPANLVIPIPTGETFFLPPRLAEFPKPTLSADLLLPVQEPHTEVWGGTTIGAVHDSVLNSLVKELDGLDLSPSGQGGGSDIEIIKLYDLTLPTDDNVFSSARTLYEIERYTETLDDRYIRKDQDDIGYGFYTWEAGWMTKSTIRSAEYNLGWDAENPTGWSVSETGTAWYMSLNIRGPILSNNIIGSPYYASGWTGFGSQWDLANHRLETDFISVRKELRVYALDVFRIYGTNGDLAVSTTNKIDRVEDMGSVWRCHIDDYDGEMYMNMRIDDIVKCQTWEKLSGRYYMARVTNIDEKWFELSKTLLEGTTTPAPGDILIRWDNLTNADRKGLLYLSASDSYAPYMDVRYGDWNATVGTIKVRNGRLDGINDPLFPELYGARNNFGLYTCNFYGTGELILRSTGESVSRTFEVLKDSIKMGLDEVRYELQVSQGSVLVNPAFQDGISSWDVTNVYYPWILNNNLIQSNYKVFTNFVSGAMVVTDDVINRPALQVADSTVIQRNILFTTKIPGKYMLRFSYRSLLPFGSLEIGVPGSQLNIKVNLSDNSTYQKGEIAGNWDGMGDFTIKVNGVVNISDISFVDDKLGNAINDVKVYYDTKLTFYAEKAVMNSFREEYDEFNRVVRKDYATQTWSYNMINTEVGTIINGKLTNYSTISQTSTAINAAVRDLNMGQYATTTWTSSQIKNEVGNIDLSKYATTSWTNEQITNAVRDKANNGAWDSDLTQTAKSLTATFTAQINGVKGVTEAFYKFDINHMRLNRRIEMGSGSDDNFTSRAGMSPDTTGPAFWAGSTWEDRANSSIRLGHDGAGWLAKKNILWDTVGNTQITGKLTSNSSGNRIVIDPSNRAINMYNPSNQLLGSLEWFTEGSITSPRLFLKQIVGASLHASASYSASMIDFNNEYGLLMRIGGGTIFAPKMPMAGGYPQKNGMLYRDENNYVRIDY